MDWIKVKGKEDHEGEKGYNDFYIQTKPDGSVVLKVFDSRVLDRDEAYKETIECADIEDAKETAEDYDE